MVSEQERERCIVEARQLAAQAWCTEKTSATEMDVDLAEAFANILVGVMAKPFSVKKHFPEAKAILYTGPLDFTNVRCSKELINRMIVIADKQDCELKTLLISEEDMADIMSYDEHSVAEYTRKRIEEASDLGKTWGIHLQVSEELKGSGVIIGLTDKEWKIIVGETGRYSE